MTRWRLGLSTTVWLACAATMVAAPGASAQSRDEQIELLRRQLAEQQRMIEQMQRQLEELQRANTETREVAGEAERKVEEVRSKVADAPIVTSGNERIKVSISGQVNRAINVVDDGDKTKTYFVDNDVSNTRFRIKGSGEITEELSVGTNLEFAVSPNNSYDVSQDQEDAGELFTVRRAEAFFNSTQAGRLWMGKGSAAADDTAEYDLSLVSGPIMYAGVADPVGGIQFTSGGDLSGITIGDAFFDFDGDRQNRVRYDTPVLGPGVQLSASAGADQRYDAAVNWGGDFGDWTGVEVGPMLTLGALSISDPNEDGTDFRLAGSWSMLHQPTGIGVTLSAGGQRADGANPFNTYAKLFYDTQFVPWGQTGFGVDFTYGENLPNEDDKTYSVGGAVVQTVDDYGIEFYGQLRWFELDNAAGPSLDNILAGTVGTRVKF